ncbi:MAG TPA: choice-of-anchor tandem repeat GloVer-containing protein [Candidatus Babeliales bacterium]|nr:choice-of-anchor tandem repeat GloVer-containing protein [Candidatus Babeliales bacterium]
MERNGILIVSFAALAACAQIGGNSGLPGGSPAARSQSASKPRNAGYLQMYSFKGNATGANPEGRLLYVKGELYGAASSGGLGVGTVFSVTPLGRVNPVYEFHPDAADGAYPEAGLVDLGGMLYGTTAAGGTYDGGTVYAVSPSGAEHIVHNFGHGSDGADPQSELIVVNGVLYGTTYNGGTHKVGTVFSITPGGSERVLHSFKGAPTDGAHPSAGLTYANGWFYGVTRAGGQIPPGGAAFKIDTNGQETILHAFGVLHGDGENPAGTLLFDNGELYGTTLHGGIYARGTLFEMDTSGNEIKLHDFGRHYNSDDSYPATGVTLSNHGRDLWGTAEGGGTACNGASCGAIFRYQLLGVGYSVEYAFGGYDSGANPEGALVNINGTLYGTTFWGGSDEYYGTIFEIQS